MPSSKNVALNKVSTLPEEMLESVIDFVDYLELQRDAIAGFESKYGSFDKLKSKIMEAAHTWEEECELAEWESAITELERIHQILKQKSED